jgi:hypothetical protein
VQAQVAEATVAEATVAEVAEVQCSLTSGVLSDVLRQVCAARYALVDVAHLYHTVIRRYVDVNKADSTYNHIT